MFSVATFTSRVGMTVIIISHKLQDQFLPKNLRPAIIQLYSLDDHLVIFLLNFSFKNETNT